MRPDKLKPLDNDTPLWGPRWTREPLDELPLLGWRLILWLSVLALWATILYVAWWT